MQWLKLPAWKVGDRGFEPHSGIQVSKKKIFLHCSLVNIHIIVGSLRDREVACLASDRNGWNVESYVWRAVSSHSSHHPQEVLLAQFSLNVHKSGLRPHSFMHSFTMISKTIQLLLFWSIVVDGGPTLN